MVLFDVVEEPRLRLKRIWARTRSACCAHSETRKVALEARDELSRTMIST
jgi:hypothetical protein